MDAGENDDDDYDDEDDGDDYDDDDDDDHDDDGDGDDDDEDDGDDYDDDDDDDHDVDGDGNNDDDDDHDVDDGSDDDDDDNVDIMQTFCFTEKKLFSYLYLRLVSIHRLLLCQTKTAKKMPHCHLIEERTKRNQVELRCLHLCQQHRETPLKGGLNPLHQLKEKVQQQSRRQNVRHFLQQPNQAWKGNVLLPRNFPGLPELKNGKFIRWNCLQQSLQNLLVPLIWTT